MNTYASPNNVTLLEAVLTETYQLILFNDEVNTFDWVIQCLTKICGHTPEQAEQCAWFVHYKGKYSVSHGSYEELRLRCTALLDAGLSAKIEP